MKTPCALLLVAGLAACGEEKLPSVDSCSASWQALLPPQQEHRVTNGMAVHQDRIFLSVGWDADGLPAVDTIPITGGDRTKFAKVLGENLWVEGDKLLASYSDRLTSVALSDGKATPLLVGGTTHPQVSYDQSSYAQALNGTHFYWTTFRLGHPAIAWRLSRAGGSPEQLATFPSDMLITKLVLAGDEIMAATERWVTAFVFSSDGGPTRTLASVPYSVLVGADQRGLIQRTVGHDGDRNTLWQVPRSGEPARRFWPDMPHGFAPGAAWPDGSGGWIVAGDEKFEGGIIHPSVWALSAEGHDRRLGCAPQSQATSFFFESFTMDREAVYLGVTLVTISTGVDTSWQVVRVPLR